MKGPVVILAPFASHPPMDGASYRAWSIAWALAQTGTPCFYFAKEAFLKLSETGEHEVLATLRNNRGKKESALRTLLFRSHYMMERHLTKQWARAADLWLEKIKPELLYIHMLWMWNPKWKQSVSGSIFIDTHNYDPEWWSNLKRSDRNPLSQRVCDFSLRYVINVLADLPQDTSLVHVSTADRDRYLQHRPDLRHLVLPNGCDVEFRTQTPDYGAPRKSVYFLGALNLLITLDALQYFVEHFWPMLNQDIEMHVFGSGESQKVEELCRTNGWVLHRNLSDQQLTREISRMHYSVLPFSYSAGSKLKLLHACGRGIPVLATKDGVCGFDALPSSVFVSGDPAQWAARLRCSQAPTAVELSECKDFAEAFSWKRSVAQADLEETNVGAMT